MSGFEQRQQTVAQRVELTDRDRYLAPSTFCLAQLAEVDGIALQGLDALLQCAFAHQPLHTLDRIPLVIEQAANLAQQFHVLRPIIAPPAAPLQRPDLGELGFPETQDMLGNLELVGHLADGAKGAGRFFDPPARGRWPGRRGVLGFWLAGGHRGAQEAAPLTRFFRTCEARKTRTRRGLMGTSWPVLGLRPIRWPLRRTKKLPNEDIFTVSPRVSA